MGYHKITKELLVRLHELSNLQHPHLIDDNHTKKLVDKVYNGEQLSITEAFDCGKYYQRMLEQLRGLEDNKFYNEYLNAVLAFKWSVN